MFKIKMFRRFLWLNIDHFALLFGIFFSRGLFMWRIHMEAAMLVGSNMVPFAIPAGRGGYYNY